MEFYKEHFLFISNLPPLNPIGHWVKHGMEWIGMEWNGMEWIGMEWNGMEFYHELFKGTFSFYLQPPPH